MSRIDKFSQKVSGAFGDEEIILYVKSILKHHGQQVSQLSADCIGHIRQRGNGKYELSIVSATGNAITINAYVLLSEARKDIKAKQTPRKHKPVPRRRKNSSKKQARKLKSKGIKKNTNKASSNNAMAIAFAEAKKKKNEYT